MELVKFKGDHARETQCLAHSEHSISGSYYAVIGSNSLMKGREKGMEGEERPKQCPA